MPDGQLSNLYTLKLANKTHQQKRITLKLQNIPGEIKVLGTELIVEPEALAKTSVLIKLSPEILANGRTPIVVGVFDDGQQIETIHTVFIGPQNQSRNSQ